MIGILSDPVNRTRLEIIANICALPVASSLQKQIVNGAAEKIRAQGYTESEVRFALVVVADDLVKRGKL